MDLPTTPAANAIFDAWSESLETHAHLMGRKKDEALASIRATEAHIGRALAELSKVRNQLELQPAQQ